MQLDLETLQQTQQLLHQIPSVLLDLQPLVDLQTPNGEFLVRFDLMAARGIEKLLNGKDLSHSE